MRKTLLHIKQHLFDACSICVIFTLALFAFNALMHKTGNFGVSFKQYAILLLFSVIIAYANDLFKLKNLAFFARLLLHFFVLAIAFYVVFLLAGMIRLESTANFFMAFLLYTIFYAVFFGIVLLIKKCFYPKKEDKKAKNTSEKKPYQNMFD